MSDAPVPVADLAFSEADVETVAEVYRSGWLTMGPRTEELEHAFAAYTGMRHAVALSSGTAALHLACLAAGLGRGDEVVVPSLTFIATVNAIAYTGAQPVFADVAGLRQPWLSAAAAEQAISERTKAIMTMTYGGHPGDTAALRELSERHGLLLLEDAAHAAGSRLDGRHLGTFGLAGAFSFFSNKNLAVGEGGMLISDDDELAERVRMLRSWGVSVPTWDRKRGRPSEYDVGSLGFNYRIDEARAALAWRRLHRLDEDNRRRGEHDAHYRRAFADVDGLTLTMGPAKGAVQSHHLFTIVLEQGIDRAAFRAALSKRGIQTSVHYPPVHGFSLYARTRTALPATEEYSARTVTLPLFSHMTEDQRERVIDAVRAGAPDCRA
jgi:dTDP-4-amino-4,6-dideoxygalactose transaminase